MSDIFKRLAAPFDPALVSWRVGSTNKKQWQTDNNKAKRGQVLAYVDARDVENRLDEVLGPFGWQCVNIPMSNGTTCCEIWIRDPDTKEWIKKSNGAGATGDVEKETEREMAEKGAYSDAFKRAAVKWGIGRYLYDLDSPWITLTDYWTIPDHAKKELHALLEKVGGGAAPKERPAGEKSGDKKKPEEKTGDKEKPAEDKPRELSKADARYEYQRIEQLLRASTSLADLKKSWDEDYGIIKKFPQSWIKELTKEKDRIKGELMREAA